MIGYPNYTVKSSENNMRFLEVTEHNNGKRKLVLNIAYVLSFWPHLERTQLMLSTGDVLDISEPYSAIRELIFP